MGKKSARQFEAQAETIRRAVEMATEAEESARKKKLMLRPAETANGLLYVQCYRYYRSLKRDPAKLKLLEKHLAGEAESRWRRHYANGPEIVLRLIEPPPPATLLTATKRHRIGIELEFADKCGIHWKLLLAFLHEGGGQKRIIQLAKDPQLGSGEAWITHYQRMSKLLRANARSGQKPTTARTATPRKRNKSKRADS